MPTASDAQAPKSTDIKAQLEALRDQVATLVEARASPLDDAARLVQEKARDLGDTVMDHAETLAGQVRDKPIAALLIAAGLGYVIGRLAR